MVVVVVAVVNVVVVVFLVLIVILKISVCVKCILQLEGAKVWYSFIDLFITIFMGGRENTKKNIYIYIIYFVCGKQLAFFCLLPGGGGRKPFRQIS